MVWMVGNPYLGITFGLPVIHPKSTARANGTFDPQSHQRKELIDGI